MQKLTISKMSGKMEGFRGVNLNPLSNEFCQKMRVGNTICRECYSVRLLQSARKSAVGAFERNSQLMQSGPIADEQIPRFYPGEHVRLLAHGELINDQCFLNFCKVAEFNRNSHFVMWTKRVDIVKANVDAIPTNVTLMYSTPAVDIAHPRVPDAQIFNGTFNVYTHEFAKEHNIDINCPGKCSTCMRCYTQKHIVVNELIRRINYAKYDDQGRRISEV